MAAFWSMLALALAVSLDGLSAGMMYGFRKIKMPLTSIAIVSVCSGFVLFGSMAVGEVFADWLPEHTAKWIGALILIAIGCWAMIQMVMSSRRERDGRMQEEASESDHLPADEGSELPALKEERTIFLWEIRQLGVIVQILRTPSMADMDRSGTISASEAILLGIALSLDSVGAGIGAALIGFPPVATALLIAGSSGLCIAAGARLGWICSGWKWMGKLTLLPGFILIVMGIMKLL